ENPISPFNRQFNQFQQLLKGVCLWLVKGEMVVGESPAEALLI
ncbi:hypothetical protein CEXT_186641, partial [Caerostris extrusa]